MGTGTKRLPTAQRWANVFDLLSQCLVHDDECCDATTLKTVQNVLSFVAKHYDEGNPPDQVGRSPTGELVFYWHEDSAYREAEFDDDRCVEWMEVLDGQPARHWHEYLKEIDHGDD